MNSAAEEWDQAAAAWMYPADHSECQVEIDRLSAELAAAYEDADRLAAWITVVTHPNSGCYSMPDGFRCLCGKRSALTAHSAAVASRPTEATQ